MVKPASQRARHANLHPHHIRRKTAAVAVAACFSTGVAMANPTAPTVVRGTVSMNQAGGILNITNSHNAIINWGSFSIGASELTRFIQPSALSAVLNRVVGSDPSAILGALQSNGRVFLINPNGIMFGSGAQINVAGLVASTLNLSNEDFLNNRMRFTDGALAGGVLNQGNITGGSVYLIGNAVANKGLITSPNGEVVLAAGNSVELVSPGTPNLRVEVVAPANEAVNLGTISAEAGRVGIYAGLIRQGGTISADSAVAEGGRIMLKSTKSTVIEAGSVTSARGTSGGQIVALSDMTDGKTEVAGKLDASAIASGTPGAGGFIETSAAQVRIAESAVINAAGSNGGKAGTWLIDPTDFYISNAYGGDMSATFLSSTLGSYGSGTNVDVFSTSGLTGSSGTVFVNDAVTWSSDATLRLIAVGNVEVNAAITNTGVPTAASDRSVKLYAGWTGAFDGSSNPIVGPTAALNRNITVSAPISTQGEIHLIAHGNIAQGAPGSLTAGGLLASSATGSVNLANASATNTVGTIAGKAIGQFAFKNNSNLTIGSVGGVNGISADGVNPGRHVTVDVNVVGGALTVSQPVIALAADGPEGQAGGNANISLSATNGITVNANLIANAGHGGFGAFVAPGDGGVASISLTSTGAAGDVTINSGAVVQANGGGGGDAFGFYGGGVGARGGDATVTISSARDVTVAGQVEAFGGHGGYGSSAGGGRAGDATISISSVRDVTVSGRVRALGGEGGSGSSGAGGRGGDALISLAAGGALNINSTIANSVQAEGGEGGAGWRGDGGPGGNATVNLTSTGAMTLGNVSAPAGSTAYALGGAGGRTYGGEGFNGGDGGHATVTATSAGGITVNAVVEARGGEAYAGFGSSGSGSFNFRGRGGDALINLNNTSTGMAFVQTSSSGITAEGGRGSVGGNASVSIASAAGLEVRSVYSYGGQGSSASSNLRRGGDASINLQNTSTTAPLTILNSVYASGGATYSGSGTADGGNASIVIGSAGGLDHHGFIVANGSNGAEGGNGGDAFVQLTVSGGSGLRVDGGEIFASGGNGGFSSAVSGGVGGKAEIRLISSSGILLDGLGSSFNHVNARGGEGGSTGAFITGGADGGAGGSGTVFIQNTSASAGVSINMNVAAEGGEGGYGTFGFLSGTSVGGRGGDATITISSASAVDQFSNGQISAYGGLGGQGSYRHMGSSSTPPLGSVLSTGGRGGDATVTISAVGGVTVSGTRGIEVLAGYGGDGAFTEGFTGSGSIGYWSERSGTGGRGGDGLLSIQAGNGISTLDSTYLVARGGDGGGYSTGGFEVFGNGGNGSVMLNNTGTGIAVELRNSGNINAYGGEGQTGGNASTTVMSAGGINTGMNAAVQAWGGAGVNGGNGGSASLALTSTSTTSGITIDGGEVFANGGDGGYNSAARSGNGGNASVTVASAGGILVNRFVGASAGAGGSNSGFGAGDGGNAAVTFNNSSATAPIAVNGYPASGSVNATGGWGLTGGNADVAMTSAAGILLNQTGVTANGGTGYAESAATSAQGGTASVVLNNTNTSAGINAQNSLIYASGGTLDRSAGVGGNGGDAVVILSSAGSISLTNSFAGGSGGDIDGSGGAPSDRGGSAGLTMLAGGNILIEGGEGSARGGNAPLGGSAAVNLVAGGNILIEGGEGANNLLAFSSGLAPGNASVVASAGGSLTLTNAGIGSTGLSGLGGGNILVDSSVVVGVDGLQVDASGRLTVTNGGVVAGFLGNAKITTGGNLVVENDGLIMGYPDVFLKVGGEILMNAGGRIEAGLPTTIHLTFPMLTSGGFTVNGVPGLVFDGSTGFFAGGVGAVLGTNLLITYGGGAELVVPTETLIVAMSESVKPPDAEKKKDIFEDENQGKKKKDAPVCR